MSVPPKNVGPESGTGGVSGGGCWFRVLLRPLPDKTPAAVRLRQALKVLLRAYRLRAEEVQEVEAGRGGEKA